MAGGARWDVINGGTVTSMDPATGDLDPGEVLLEDDVIVGVAEHIDAPVSGHEARYLVAF